MCTGSLSKMFCLPGWKVGWLIVYNYHGYFDKILPKLRDHQGILDAPTSVAMHSVPRILKETPEEYFEQYKRILNSSSDHAY